VPTLANIPCPSFFVKYACESKLTPADLLYLFCTCTGAFHRFSPIEPFEFLKSFENSTTLADRLPPPPNQITRYATIGWKCDRLAAY
jgi:hypothetical protein